MNALLIDIGNSRVKWRVAELGRVSSARSVPWHGNEEVLWLDDVRSIGARLREIDAGPDGRSIDAAFVSNVASDEVGTLVVGALATRWPDARIHVVRPLASQAGVVNGYREPARLGPDRWLALIAAHALVPNGTLLVCSLGTATTIDLLERDVGAADATFVGGMIVPGIDAMKNALASATARLTIGDGRLVDFADRTEDAITSGVLTAQAGAIERSLRLAQARAAMRRKPRPIVCIVAGGGAAVVAPLLQDLDAEVRLTHDLVLRGLSIVASESALRPA